MDLTLQRCIEETSRKLAEKARQNMNLQPEVFSQDLMPQQTVSFVTQDSPLAILLKDRVRPISKVV